MSQPPNPPSGGTPQQPGGWQPQPGSGDWQSDPTQQLPTQPQYPPTQPLPAQEQFPGYWQDPAGGGYGGGQYPQGSTGQYGQGQPGQYGQGAAGQYGQGQPGQYGPGSAGGQPPGGGQYGSGATPNGPGYGPAGAGSGYGAPGQYGGAPGANAAGYPPSGQYGPAGGGFGAPPSGGGFGGPPPGGGRSGRNPVPLIIGIVAGVLVLGLVGWFLFLRPGTTATPSPSVSAPQPSVSATPSVLITPSGAPSTESSPSGGPSTQPSGTTSAACSPQLNKTQCDWAAYLRKFVRVETCQPDSSDMRRDAFTCAANARGKLKGSATVTMRWADDSKDLTGLMDDFFVRAGIAKNKIGKNWKKPPAHTNWWYTDTPKKIEGKLGSAKAKDGSGRVAWTFSKQRFFVEAASPTDSVNAMVDWWART
jgi:hypothetical protein